MKDHTRTRESPHFILDTEAEIENNEEDKVIHNWTIFYN